MSAPERPRRVRVGNVSIELPAALATRPDAPIDSAAAVFEGEGLTVLIDQGPFAPSLDADVGRPGFRWSAVDVGGVTGRQATFRAADGATYTTAVELATPQRVTVVVRADRHVAEQIPRGIIRSIQLQE